MLKNVLKHVSVNKWTFFHNLSFLQNAVWTIFEQFYFEILRIRGKLKKPN